MQESFEYKLTQLVRLTSIADAIGAPVEMYTREDLLENLDSYLKKFPRRENPYDIGCQPGEYTDDTQMTIATARHLLRIEQEGYTPFNFELYMTDLLSVYDEDEKEKNVPRGGHGGFKEIATLGSKIDRIEYQRSKNIKNLSKVSDPNVGNGSGMRLNSFIISNLKDKQLVEFVIGTTLSTHNDTIAVIGNLLVVNILRSLYQDSIDTTDVINVSLTWLEGDNDKSEIPSLKICHNMYNMLVKNDLVATGDFMETVNDYVKYLKEIDTIPDCNNDLTNINPLIHLITLVNAKPCIKKGGSGLPARSKQTVGWFHYLLKNLHSCINTLDIIKRCLLVGGDTDTLAVYVYPISYIVLNRIMQNELPKYIMEQLTEIDQDLLRNRIKI